MTEPEYVGPRETFEKLKSGTTLLVCAYDDEEKFRAVHLEGAISLKEFRSRLASLSRYHEIIFYCA